MKKSLVFISFFGALCFFLSSAFGPASAAVINAIPVQGRLTDASGNPINGSKELTFTIYDAFSGGNSLCQDADTVNVINGLFYTNIDYCTPDDINGRQLYLGIKVAGEAAEMTPRLPIYVVPYAFSLIPGAVIDGSLRVTGDTVISVSPQKMVQSGSSNVTFQSWSDGYQSIRANFIGTDYVYIPVDLPSKIFGVSQKLKSAQICYDLDSTATYISETNIQYVTGTGTAVDLLNDLNNRTSTSWACYTLTMTTPAVIVGPISIRFVLSFANTTDRIFIGKISLTLTEQ